jgi:hypothetical protein
MQAGMTYHYWLEIMDVHGTPTRYGPAPATVPPARPEAPMPYRILLPLVSR